MTKKQYRDRRWYRKKKDEFRQIAVKWQCFVSDKDMSYGELNYWADYFNFWGSRFGLLREFRENGIPC